MLPDSASRWSPTRASRSKRHCTGELNCMTTLHIARATYNRYISRAIAASSMKSGRRGGACDSFRRRASERSTTSARVAVSATMRALDLLRISASRCSHHATNLRNALPAPTPGATEIEFICAPICSDGCGEANRPLLPQPGASSRKLTSIFESYHFLFLK